MFADRSVPWLAYPGTIAVTLALHSWLLSFADDALIAAYISMLVGAGLVTLLEWYYPNQKQWRPAMREVIDDLVYMGIVQMILPKLLTISVALIVAGALWPDKAPFTSFWPHQYPIVVQVILMVIGADFLHYWLHRAAHTYNWLWRVHAVHHSPHRLYWLNVGRFHPIDKTLQFLVDILPFILLGVSPEVMSFYFVFYAVNGFLQHSNVKMRYGLLNYLISGAELHRWHHSYLPKEANTNYGANLIIFDLMFGTRFLPRGRQVGALGLINRNYPMQFVDQLSTPFIPEITNRDVPTPNFLRFFRR